MALAAQVELARLVTLVELVDLRKEKRLLYGWMSLSPTFFNGMDPVP